MIRLTDLLELQMQPSEPSRIKNFLYRGTRDQIMQPYDDEGSTTYSKMKGTIEEEPLTVDHPENKRRTVGWEWDQLNTLEESEYVNLKNALAGRELQTLQDVRKMVARLKARGYDKAVIVSYIMSYLDNLDETVGYAMITKPAVDGGINGDSNNLY